MSDGQWIESATLDLWEGRHREQLNRIKELEAENRRLGQQCEGLMQAGMNNGQALILAEAKLAQQDDLVQAAVAAALREAALIARNVIAGEMAYDEILSLITPDAQAALDRVVAAERERCINLAATWSKDAAAAIREGGE